MRYRAERFDRKAQSQAATELHKEKRYVLDKHCSDYFSCSVGSPEILRNHIIKKGRYMKMNEPIKFMNTKDVAKALGCSLPAARAVMKPIVFELK